MENKIKKFFEFITEKKSSKRYIYYRDFKIEYDIVYEYAHDNYFYYYDESMVDDLLLAFDKNNDEFYVDIKYINKSIKPEYEEKFKQNEINNDEFERYQSYDIKLYMEENINKYDAYKEILKNWDEIENKYEDEEDFYSFLTEHVHSELFFKFMYEYYYGDAESPAVYYLENIFGNEKETREFLVKHKAINYVTLNDLMIADLSDEEMIKYYIEMDICYDENRLKMIVDDNAYSLFEYCDCTENDFFEEYDFQKKVIMQFVEFNLDKPFNEINENEKKIYISDFLVEMEDKVKLNSKIKKDFKKYMYKIAGRKFNI